MSVSGLCQVCEAASAQAKCDRCGALVCRTHFERGLGVCAECAAEAGRGRNREGGETFRF